jgi:hypothetical protein
MEKSLREFFDAFEEDLPRVSGHYQESFGRSLEVNFFNIQTKFFR